MGAGSRFFRKVGHNISSVFEVAIEEYHDLRPALRRILSRSGKSGGSDE